MFFVAHNGDKLTHELHLNLSDLIVFVEAGVDYFSLTQANETGVDRQAFVRTFIDHLRKPLINIRGKEFLQGWLVAILKRHQQHFVGIACAARETIW